MIAHSHTCMRCGETIPCLSPNSCDAGEFVFPRLAIQDSRGNMHTFEHMCVIKPGGALVKCGDKLVPHHSNYPAP